MKLLLLIATSALGLFAAAEPARAEDPSTLKDRFASELPLAPFSVAVPTSPAYLLGVGAIDDPRDLGLDRTTTGEIHNPDAEEAAKQLEQHGASPGGFAPIEAAPAARSAPPPAAPGEMEDEATLPAAVPHAVDAATGAAAAEHPPEAGAEAGQGAPDWATARSPEPFDIIRTIQFLQDQVARGNGRAIRVQAALLRRFAPVFLEADRKVWAQGRNARAAVLFVLSGGPPEVLRQLMASGALDEAQKPLFEGALAYVENDLEKARTMLGGLDLAQMEPALAAHINLVLGQIDQLKHPKDAVRRLDQARLLAPGGLIEEAALRMEVMIVEGLGDHAMADRLARQYFDRYARSSYSANFEARFAAVYAGRGTTEPAAAIATILDVTTRLPASNRRALLLAVARRSLVDGKLDLADLASSEAAKIEGTLAADRERAALYSLAAKLGSLSATEASAELTGIDRAELHPEDAKLLDAAASVLGEIERSLELPGTLSEADQVGEGSPVFDRGRQILNEVAIDLRKAQP